MDETKANEVLQWHPAFYAGIQIELEEEAANLIFENEHQLSKKPLEIDVLIIKKDRNVPIRKNIGRIFRKYNIVEYKSPADYLSIDDFYKVYGYACIYKADTGSADEIKFKDMTITFVCHKYPYKLIRHLRKYCNDEVRQREAGIYLVKGEKIPIQIIMTSRLSEKDNLWLKCLNNPVRETKTVEKLTQIYRRQRKNSLYEAAMDLIVRVNMNIFREGNAMCKALEELVDEMMGEKMKEQIKAEVEERVEAELKERVEAELEAKVEERVEAELKAKVEERVEAELQARVAIELNARECRGKSENILELLEDYGEIPRELRMKIAAEQDFNILKKWIRLAARATSIEEFQIAM